MTYAVPHRIETKRLVIRRFEHEDAHAQAIVVPRNLDHLRRYMLWAQSEPLSAQQRRDYIDHTHAQSDAGTDFALGMFTTAGEFIGGTGFHVHTEPDRLEIGYWIDAQREGQGLVTEAVSALTLVAFELAGAETVGISHAPSNTRSAAIPARLGYVRQDRPSHDCSDTGQMVTGVMWLATRDHLAREPFASAARPRAFDGRGQELAWSN